MDSIKKPNAAPPVPPSSDGQEQRREFSAIPPPVAPKGGGGGDKRQRLELLGHVGFDALPQQLVSKATAEGFVFNILCVGETGIGKSTLMESLFNIPLDFEPCDAELSKVELKEKTYEISESAVRLKLRIVETAGYGDQLDKEKSAETIKEYIEEQYDAYLKEELKIKRCLPLYQDTRIHACLYFISPTGHGLRTMDVLTMKLLAPIVNLIPIIAKADTTSKDELKRFKAKVSQELQSKGISIYRFPESDETVAEQNRQLNAQMPFAVVGSVDFVKKGGKSVRARNYPWGIVEVENEEHCDFVKLREALLRLNVEDLRCVTAGRLYEAFRYRRLGEMGFKDSDAGPKYAESIREKKAQAEEEMHVAEDELKRRFVARVEDKERQIRQREQDLQARYEAKFKDLDEREAAAKAQLERLDAELLYYQNMARTMPPSKKLR